MVGNKPNDVDRSILNNFLKKSGWKVYSTSTLARWKKKDLIQHIRDLEYNYAVLIERWERTLVSIKELLNKLKINDTTIEIVE